MSGSKGRSQQQQSSSSESESSGKSSSSGSVISGGQDQSTSGGVSGGTDFSQQFVDQSQQPFLDFLRSQGQQLAGDQLGGGQFQNDILNPTVAAFNQQLQGDPELLRQQIQQRQFGVTENLQQNLLPSIQNAAQGAGQVGSSRQGVAEGIALRDASRQQQNIATDLGGQAQQRQLQALGIAPSVGNLGFQPLQNFGQIVGGPTVLGQGGGQQFGSSFGQSTGSRFSEALSQSEGLQSASGRGTGQGSGSSKTFGLGFI